LRRAEERGKWSEWRPSLTDWKDFISNTVLKTGRYEEPGKFGPPASKENLEALWKCSTGRVPAELLEFYSQADGVGAPGGGRFIVSIAEALGYNQYCRTDDTCREYCKPFDDLLFFADPGWTGDLFGYDLAQPDKPIIRWMAIGDDRDWKARDLKDLIEGWYPNRIGA
jgi:hypothetical protein